MLDSISNALDAFRKLAPVPLIALATAASILLFATDDLAETLGVDEFRTNYRGIIGGILIASLSYLLAHFIWWSRAKVIRWWNRRSYFLRVRRNLEMLTPVERGYLVPFIHGGQASVHFAFDDGVAHSLVEKGILQRAGGMARVTHGIPHLMAEFARLELMVRPELLDNFVPHEQPQRFY